jgi:hypothetical protein
MQFQELSTDEYVSSLVVECYKGTLLLLKV